MYITGKKSDESLVEVHLKRPEWILSELKYAITQNYGGSESDYSFYLASADDETKVRDGWEFNLTWSGNEITAIDFTPETNKRWIKMSASKSEIVGDGVETVELTLEVWKADESAVDPINITADVPIKTPDGLRWVKATVVNGVLTKNFKTTKTGLWVFPSNRKRFTSTTGQKARVMNQVEVQVIQTGVFD